MGPVGVGGGGGAGEGVDNTVQGMIMGSREWGEWGSPGVGAAWCRVIAPVR